MPQKEEGKSIFFIGSIMSRPWIKHIYLFVHQALGCSTTLASCSRYIELCPPPFGYSSKHVQSLCCLLLRKLMINAMLSKSHHLSCYCPREVSTKPESAPLQFVSFPHTRPSWMSNQVLVRNQWSLQSDQQDYLVHDRQAIEDLWVVKSYTHITLLPWVLNILKLFLKLCRSHL